ncbi:hypothetical protein Sango_1736600 [Sesamum angolense]|uniref:Uncharacterized protein n=1 Tax=Sesamum angolense TaxID=2727404 RepID=A0AAE2BSD0_9LAMI|nr:hypothetical protein Sango_1736600 [Sesamum angolense]
MKVTLLPGRPPLPRSKLRGKTRPFSHCRAVNAREADASGLGEILKGDIQSCLRRNIVLVELLFGRNPTPKPSLGENEKASINGCDSKSQQGIGATVSGEPYALMRALTDGVKEMLLAASYSRRICGGQGIDDEQKPESGGKAEREGAAEVNRRGKLKGAHSDHLGSSRSLKNEKGKNPALSSAAVIHEGFGDTGNGEPEEYVAHDWINEKSRSQKFKKNYADVSPVENEDEISKVPKEDELRESEEEGTKTTLKGKAVVPPAGSPPVVSEIPLRFPSPCPNQMATLNLSSIIGIDPNQFDPATYVEEDFYVTDAFGVNRLIPPNNIISWREVTNPDGTNSVESKASFVTWSDGSLQLLIGKEAFGIYEQDAQGIASYPFLRHEQGIYQSQGLISRKMIVMPSSVTSNLNYFEEESMRIHK